MDTNLIVGTENGTLKGVSLVDDKYENVQLNGDINAGYISCICWSNQDDQVIAGLRSGSVVGSDWSANLAQSPVIGLTAIDQSVVAGYGCGAVKVFRSTGEVIKEYNSGENMTAFGARAQRVATGGKESDLKVWDVNSEGKTPIFEAKNVRNNFLNVRVPIWVSDVKFFPDCEKSVAVGTGHHELRIYDISSGQRRPVCSLDWDKHPVTCVAPCPGQEKAMLAANSAGKMIRWDLRQPKRPAAVYKGFSGGVRGLYCHPREPVVYSVSLDRFLRVHHRDTREMIKQIYLKAKLTSILVKDTAQVIRSEDTVTADVTDEGEDVWAGLKEVRTRVVRKRKLDDLESDDARVAKQD